MKLQRIENKRILLSLLLSILAVMLTYQCGDTKEYLKKYHFLELKLFSEKDDKPTWVGLGLTNSAMLKLSTNNLVQNHYTASFLLNKEGAERLSYLSSELIDRKIGLFVDGNATKFKVNWKKPLRNGVVLFDHLSKQDTIQLSKWFNNASPKMLEDKNLLVAQPTCTLSLNDVAHGEFQLERMLSDRPQMKRFIKKNDPLWQYIIEKFAGNDIGIRVYWYKEHSPELKEFSSEFNFSEKHKAAYINIRENNEQGVPLDGEYMWHCAIFELFNVRNFREITELEKRAISGTVQKEIFIRKIAELEFNALKSTSSFYNQFWVPYSLENNFQSAECFWIIKSENFENWIRRYEDKNGYPYKNYGYYYDRLVNIIE